MYRKHIAAACPAGSRRLQLSAPFNRAWRLFRLAGLGLAGACLFTVLMALPTGSAHAQQFCSRFSSVSIETEAVCPGPVTSENAGTSGSTQRQIEQRLEHLRCENSSDPNCAGGGGASQDSVSYEGLGVFVSGDYQHKDKQQTNFEMGFTSDSYGPTLGVDYRLDTFGVIGMAFDFSHTDGEFDHNFGDFNTDTLTAVLYGSYYPTDQSFIDAALGFGHKDLKADHLDPGGSGTEVGADTNGFDFTADLTGGYDFSFESVTIGPRLGIHYRRTALNSFVETGDPAATLFAYDDQVDDSLTGTVGFQASMAFSTDFGVVVPTINAEYVREFLDDRERHTVTEVGGVSSTFVTDQPDRNHFNVGAGVVVVLPDGISPFLSYEAEVANYLEETHTVTAGVRLEF